MSDEAPEGYALPKAAADLLAHAAANRWKYRAVWYAGDDIPEPFLRVEVGRYCGPTERAVNPTDEYAPVRGSRWLYTVTWHSRGCAPGRVRLFRSSGAVTPWDPVYHSGPSVKGIREMISRFPVPKP